MDIRGNRKGKGTLEIIAALAVPAVVAAILFPMFARTSPTSLGEPMYFNFDQSKKTGPGNPPDPKVPAKYIDPTRYSDLLP